MDKAFVVIIILNYNKKNDLLECIDSISKQDYRNFQVIVLDNGSTDGSSREIKNKYSDVHIIENKINSGAAGGRNIAIKYAVENFNYDFILFLDNDVVVEKYFLEEMIKSFAKDKSIGIVTPKCYMMNFPGTIGYAGGMSVNLFTGEITDVGSGQKDEGQFDRSGFVTACAGLCLVKNSVINEVGFFDENFNPYGWEDVDYSIRARKHGFKIFYNHRAIVYHKGGKKQRGELAQEYEFSKVKNYFYLLRKHVNIFQLLVISSILPFRILFIIIKELSRGEFKILFSQFRGALSWFK
jgi:GT2 family glycosyltransferase